MGRQLKNGKARQKLKPRLYPRVPLPETKDSKGTPLRVGDRVSRKGRLGALGAEVGRFAGLVARIEETQRGDVVHVREFGTNGLRSDYGRNMRKQYGKTAQQIKDELEGVTA